MADFTALKTAIQNAIKQNGNEEITGNLLQEVLLAIVSTLGDSAINDLIAALSTEVTNRQNADGTLQSNINAEQSARQLGDSILQSGINNERDLRVAADNAMQSAITTISNHLNEGYIYIGIATTATNPSTPIGKVFYIAVAAGTYTNFLNSSSQPLVLTQGINILKFNGASWSVEQVWGVDDEPTAGSDNLVKSGGVYDAISAQETETSVKIGFVYHKKDISVVGRGTQYDIPIQKTIPAEVGKTYNISLGSIVAPEGATMSSCALLLRKVKDDGSNTNVFWIYQGNTQAYTFQQSDLDAGYTKLRLMFYLSTNYNSSVGTYTFRGVTFETTNWYNLLAADNFYTSEKESDMYKFVKELYIDGLSLDNSVLKINIVSANDYQTITIYKDNIAISHYTSNTLINGGLVTLPKYNSNGYVSYILIDFTGLSQTSRQYILDNKKVIDKNFSPSIATYLAPKSNNPWKGKNLLAIGDSITAANVWQQKVGEVLEMNVSTHAKGGIGIVAMVDGQGDLAALTSSDVAGKDLIIIGGFYNERYSAINAQGQPSDMYPTQNTFIGKLNYAIKRIYQCLNDAGNMKCRIVMFSAHKYGKYPWNDQNAYYDGDILFDATKKSADYNSIPLIDLMNGGGINEYTWNTYQLYPTYHNTKYIPYGGVNDGTNHPFPTVADLPTTGIVSDRYATVEGVEGCYWWNGSTWTQDSTPYIWLGDQLHPNTDGYNLIGERIAGKLLELR